MKRHKASYIPAVLCGSLLASSPTCLPEDYFALSARNIAVAFADTVLGNLVTPLFNQIDPPMDTDDGNGDSGG